MRSLLTVHTATEELRRRGKLLAGLLLSVIGLSGVVAVGNLTQQQWAFLISEVIVMIILGGLYLLNRYGYVLAASLIFIAFTLAAPFLLFDSAGLLRNSIILCVPVFLTSLLLVSWASFVASGLMIIGLVLTGLDTSILLINGATLGIVATVSFLFASSLVRAITTAREQAEDLAKANVDLAQKTDDQAHLLLEQQRLVDDQRTLLAAVDDLAVPVIKLSDGVLLLPLVGQMTTARLDQIRPAVLNAIYMDRASTFILDITGQQTITPAVWTSMIDMIRAAALLGCQAILTGISANVAMGLSERFDALAGLRVAATLQDGLTLVLGQRNG